MEHLILNLEAPLAAFGAPSVDNYGPVQTFPAAAMLAGLLGSALGWRRSADHQRLQALQDRLVYATRIDRAAAGSAPLRDLQQARLSADDQGWTTRNRPQGRESGAATLAALHLRFREYQADLKATVALRLEPAAARPTLEELAAALDKPARPLFIGRKSCPPMSRLHAGSAEGDTALEALLSAPLGPPDPTAYREDPTLAVEWPEDDTPANYEGPSRAAMVADRKEWAAGRHAGRRPVRRADFARESFPPPPEPQSPDADADANAKITDPELQETPDAAFEPPTHPDHPRE